MPTSAFQSPSVTHTSLFLSGVLALGSLKIHTLFPTQVLEEVPSLLQVSPSKCIPYLSAALSFLVSLAQIFELPPIDTSLPDPSCLTPKELRPEPLS
jgi:hypothetical protein